MSYASFCVELCRRGAEFSASWQKKLAEKVLHSKNCWYFCSGGNCGLVALAADM